VEDDRSVVLPFPQAPEAIELRHMRAFVAVAEELSFSRAAERLYLSQPALSRQIRSLERVVGCQLLRRSTHRVELTVAGSALLDRARKLLAEAGYRDAAGNFDPKKFPVNQIEISYNPAESNRAVAEFVQAQWKRNLKLTVPLKAVEWKTFLDSRAQLEYKGFARSGWIGDFADPFTFLALFYTPRGDNGTGWWDAKYVAMLDAANKERDPQKRYALLAKAEAYMLDAQPVIPLLTNATNLMKKPYVKGMYPNPQTLHAWKFVYIERDPAKWDYGVPKMSDE
jgi:oligopeptide transport system substrate-binding protein